MTPAEVVASWEADGWQLTDQQIDSAARILATVEAEPLADTG